MSEQGVGAKRLTRAQVLDAVRELATLEHAHCVYYLRFQCALDGHASDPDGVIPAGIRAAADAAFQIAFGDMFHLRDLNRVLVLAGHEPVLDRATRVTPASGPPIDVESFDPTHFAAFPAREKALAAALDGRYARLRQALASPPPPLSGPELTELQSLVAEVSGPGRGHGISVPGLAESLTGLTPSQYLRVTGAEPADDLDARLLALGDDSYRSLVSLLRDHFADVGPDLPRFLHHALSSMDRLEQVNALLGLRRLLPPFSP